MYPSPAANWKKKLGINPCGYEGLRTVDLAACGVRTSVERAGELLAAQLARAHGQAVQQRAAALAGVPG